MFNLPYNNNGYAHTFQDFLIYIYRMYIFKICYNIYIFETYANLTLVFGEDVI